jgi:cyanophycin synthetase
MNENRCVKLRGSIIRDERRRRGLTLVDASLAADINKNTWQKAEDERPVFLSTAKCICEALGLDPTLAIEISGDGEAIAKEREDGAKDEVSLKVVIEDVGPDTSISEIVRMISEVLKERGIASVIVEIATLGSLHLTLKVSLEDAERLTKGLIKNESGEFVFPDRLSDDESAHPIKILRVNALRGSSVWAFVPVLEVWVDLGGMLEISSEMIPGFNDRLKSVLPSLVEHTCSVGTRGGFFERLDRGTYMGHVLEHIALELQCLAGSDVRFGRARETNTEGIYKIAVEYKDEGVGVASVEVGLKFLHALISGRAFNIEEKIAELRALARKVGLDTSAQAIVNAATVRNIPWQRLNAGGLIQLGHGVKQRRIYAGASGTTSAIAETISQDKGVTRRLFRAIGVPTTEGFLAESMEDAWEIAERIGLPVVVKPEFGNSGRGVTINVTSKEQMIAAYMAAQEEGGAVIVEAHAPGDNYRLLVVGERLVSAVRLNAPQVIGDGLSSIRELINRVNDDPLRSDDNTTVMNKVKIDRVALAVLGKQGLTPECVPKLEQKVFIHRNANPSVGGTATDVTDIVHPDVARQAIEAARIVGVDIAGVDILAQDIMQPLQGQRGVVLQVNSRPNLRMHIEPSFGQGRPVGEAIVEMVFHSDVNVRVPIVAVAGVNGKTTTTRLITHIIASTGKRIGMTCTDGMYVNGRRICAGDCSNAQSARDVLLNPRVEAAVFETSRDSILLEGIGYDWCDVGVVTNIGEGDHLGIDDIETVEQLANVMRCVVESVSKTGYAVLKADDPWVAAMAERCRGGVVFFAMDGDHDLIVRKRSEGGRVAFVRGNAVMLAEAKTELQLLSLDRIPLTHNGCIGFQVENVLAAAAACWTLGMPCEQIRSGLESFSANMDTVPGRFNIVELNGATMIVDFGHNASSLTAIIQAISQLPHARRTAIYSAAGGRRDIDIIRQGELLAGAFDRVVLYEDSRLQGRAPGEIAQLFKKGLDIGGRVKEVYSIPGWQRAVDQALLMIQPGELVLVQADVIHETMQYLQNKLEHKALGREIKFHEAIGNKAPESSTNYFGELLSAKVRRKIE